MIKNFFDFNLSAKEFNRLVNPDDSAEQWFLIDAKSLQLRWTDIEIRKYRLHGGNNFNKSLGSGNSDGSEDSNNRLSDGDDEEEDDDPLPPLE